MGHGLGAQRVSLAVLTGIVWFTGGVAIAMSQITVGLHATPEERGKLFGLLSVAAPLGSLLGGAAMGPAVDAWGFPKMLQWSAAVYATSILFLAFLSDPKSDLQRDEGGPREKGYDLGLGSLACFSRPLSSLQEGLWQG